MPECIKGLLRDYSEAINKAHKLQSDIQDIFIKEGVPLENLTAMSDDGPSTEALTNIDYGEGDIEENIKEIEKVYLFFTE